MRPRTRTPLGIGLAAIVASSVLASTPASASDVADVQPYLANKLSSVGGAVELPVMVHADSLGAAAGAVDAAGLTQLTTFDQIGVVVARGTKSEIAAARQQPGVTYLEGNRPVEMLQSTSHTATRGEEALSVLEGADGTALDGKGVSVGLIDSGIDPTHPFFAEPDGSSAVVANLKVVCDPTGAICEVVELPTTVDTDTLAAGGHGTHVGGIIAGRPTELSDGSTLHGAAPGANLVSLSTGAVLFVIGADAALNWVLENHEQPCGPDVSAADCPPIKVTNNSYGPSGGGEFDPQSATVKLQQALAAEGVLTVWAAGNDGGDGSQSLTNPPGQDPTPGILSVASYFDQGTGTRDGAVSSYSSRGMEGDLSTYPDVSAPGEDITSSCRLYLPICATGLDPRNGPGLLDIGTFNTISGTSMAAPHIAGIVAQLAQADPTATPAQIEDAIKLTAYQYTDGADYVADPDGGVTSYDKGHGLVDVVAAAEALGAQPQ